VFYKLKEFNSTFYNYYYIINILLIRNIKYYNIIFNFIYKKQKVYIIYIYKEKYF
jgi:hypothetical protein